MQFRSVKHERVLYVGAFVLAVALRFIPMKTLCMLSLHIQFCNFFGCMSFKLLEVLYKSLGQLLVLLIVFLSIAPR